MIYYIWELRYIISKEILTNFMRLVSKFIPYHMWFIVRLVINILNYLCAYLCGNISLSLGYASHASCAMWSARFVTISQNLVCMVSFIYLSDAGILGAFVIGGNLRSVSCDSLWRYLCLVSSLFISVPVRCSIVANIILCLLIYLF